MQHREQGRRHQGKMPIKEVEKSCDIGQLSESGMIVRFRLDSRCSAAVLTAARTPPAQHYTHGLDGQNRCDKVKETSKLPSPATHIALLRSYHQLDRLQPRRRVSTR